MGLIKDMTYEQLDTYQFEFVEFKKTVNAYENQQVKMEEHKQFNCFKLPEGMTEQEAYNVLSYMYKKVSRTMAQAGDIRITKERIVKNLNANLENFMFSKVETPELVKTLYVVENNADWRTSLRYHFEGEKWYNSSVTKEEVIAIYNNLGLELPNIEISNEGNIDCVRRVDLR